MSYEILHLDPNERFREKEVSRERDSSDLVAGNASGLEIAARNDFFAALDIANFSISAIGHKPRSRLLNDE